MFSAFKIKNGQQSEKEFTRSFNTSVTKYETGKNFILISDKGTINNASDLFGIRIVHIHFGKSVIRASIADMLRIHLGMVKSVCQRWMSMFNSHMGSAGKRTNTGDVSMAHKGANYH